MLTLRMQAGYLDVVSTYVPQACHSDLDAADKHYNQLEQRLKGHFSYSPCLTPGDFNARFIKALPHETSCLGLDCLSEAQLGNRTRFAEFCLAIGQQPRCKKNRLSKIGWGLRYLRGSSSCEILATTMATSQVCAPRGWCCWHTLSSEIDETWWETKRIGNKEFRIKKNGISALVVD